MADSNALLLAPGVELHVSDDVLQRLAAQLSRLVHGSHADLTAEDEDDSGLVLPTGHPMWSHTSGGSRHAFPPFGTGDLDAARSLRRGLSPKAKVFFEELLTKPGFLFETQHFLDKFPDVFESPSAVAGALNGFTRHCEAAERAFPFSWWEGNESTPTRFAIRPDVAAVFLEVGP